MRGLTVTLGALLPAIVYALTSSASIPSSCGLKDAFPLEAADGWSFVKIAGDLKKPRGVVVDTKGNLLVVEAGKGVTAHVFGSDGCVSSTHSVIDNSDLNHGIELTPDGSQLIVSSMTTVWRYDYDAKTQSVSMPKVLVKGMYKGGHPTRTTVIPPATPHLLLVSLGSNSNMDWESLDKWAGRSLVKVFDISTPPDGGYDYNTQGWFLGYGLRNEVAVVVDKNNMIWGIENSADDFHRIVDGKSYDIHEGNPAEELNYLGDPSVSNEKWYGYPTCFTIWDGELFPDVDLPTGAQFIPTPNSTYTDETCEKESVPPRLSIQAHTAPIDGKFSKDGLSMFATLHGSWNRDNPKGYKVVEIPFKQNEDGSYEPVAEQHSKDGYHDIVWDTQKGCSASTCLRPSGLAWDRDFTKMYFASDGKEGEVFLLAKTGGKGKDFDQDEL